MLAQRFPADFDGIVVGAPVLNFSGTMTAYANDVEALRAAPIPAANFRCWPVRSMRSAMRRMGSRTA